jgi:hypothetical protein
MKNEFRIARKLLVLAALLIGTAFVMNDGSAIASAGVCCSSCDQMDFEICINKPDPPPICTACRQCNPYC